MAHVQEVLTIPSKPHALTDISSRVQQVVTDAGFDIGLCVVFIRHTSASLVIQENADPSVQHDLVAWADDLAPTSRRWRHADEGPDDMPAHAKSAVTSVSETIPIREGRLVLGTWQGIYLWEHRSFSHQRQIVVHVMGE